MGQQPGKEHDPWWGEVAPDEFERGMHCAIPGSSFVDHVRDHDSCLTF